MNGFTRLQLPPHVGTIGAVLVLSMIAASCSGGTEVAVEARSPQRTTIVDPVAAAEEQPVVDAAPDSAGDALAPGLGNAGYDVDTYELLLDWRPEDQILESEVSIRARAEAPLSEIYFDFEGSTVTGVLVDGRPADYSRKSGKLVVTLPTELEVGDEVELEVSYLTRPERAAGRSDLANGRVGWIATSDPAWYVRSAPDGAHWMLPVNDHPSDSAQIRANLTTHGGAGAVVGARTRNLPAEEHVTSRWESLRPIPPHSLTLILGDFDLVVDQEGTDATGVQLRHMLPRNMKGKLPATLGRVDDMIAFLEQRLGPFPYDAWGVAIVEDGAPSRPAHSWSIMSREEFESADVEPRMMRDLAMQYFGHDVGIESWSDVWLSEAIPTYMHWLWLQGLVGRSGLDITIAAARAKVNNSGWPAPGEPRPGDVYVGSGALRGALFLHALSLRIGQSRFFDVLSTAYREHSGGVISTEAFIQIAEEVSGEKLRAFADAWFYRDPLPGFPDA